MNNKKDSFNSNIPWWQPVLFAAMAGGMAWGIRGQYGHETGAMIAGLLVGTTLVYLLAPRLPLLNAARAIAWGTIAMGFGGSMTYGQTVGLTHDAELVGNGEALRWGLFGLAIKGGLWIGFAGTFLGMGLSGVRYRIIPITVLMLSLVAAYFIGVYFLNTPFDPANKRLPLLYFSDHWHWEPTKDLKPRFECWGGLLFSLTVLLIYVGAWRKDRLALFMAFWGILGGAIGFPLGQSIQAYHAWNPEVFQQGFWQQLAPHINWWNMMETTFGAVMGASLGLGLWLNRRKIASLDLQAEKPLWFGIECCLLAVHLIFLIPVEFMSVRFIDRLYDLGLILGLIPIVAVTAGRWWPFLVMFPITLIPIAGKTVRQLVYNEELIHANVGWIIYFIIPIVLSCAMMIWLGKRDTFKESSGQWMGYALLFNAWLYFLLNYAFFHFPWPWAEWTIRTPNGIIFTVCVIGLTIAYFLGRKQTEKIETIETPS